MKTNHEITDRLLRELRLARVTDRLLRELRLARAKYTSGEIKLKTFAAEHRLIVVEAERLGVTDLLVQSLEAEGNILTTIDTKEEAR
jgi:hypothetical protein